MDLLGHAAAQFMLEHAAHIKSREENRQLTKIHDFLKVLKKVLDFLNFYSIYCTTVIRKWYSVTE